MRTKGDIYPHFQTQRFKGCGRKASLGKKSNQIADTVLRVMEVIAKRQQIKEHGLHYGKGEMAER